MPRILIVEDDPVIRQTIDYALRRAGFDTLVSDNGSRGLQTARDECPDLILLDIMLPGLDGFSFTERLRRSDVGVAIIIVSALDQSSDLVRGLDAGADDYIIKPFSVNALLARVRANLRRATKRRVLVDARPIEVADVIIEPDQFRVSVKGEPVRLRPKEFQVLVALASQPGALLTRKRLAEQVWGYEFMPSSRTIDVHIRRVRKAVEDPSDYVLIHTVHGLGYRLEPEPKGEAADLPTGDGGASAG